MSEEVREIMTPMPPSDVAQMAILTALRSIDTNIGRLHRTQGDDRKTMMEVRDKVMLIEARDYSAEFATVKADIEELKAAAMEQRGMTKLAGTIKGWGPFIVAGLFGLFAIFDKRI